MDKFNEYFEKLIAMMPGHVYWKDKNGVYLGCNDLQAKSAGLMSRKNIIGKTDYDLPWKKYADKIRRIDLTVMKSGAAITVEEPLLLSDGKQAIVLSNKVPLKNENGEVLGILGISIDISEHKKIEDKLKASQDETKIALENILNNVPAHIFWKDCNSIILGCNDLQAKNMGFASGKEMIGKSNYEVIWPNQPERAKIQQADAITKIDKEVMATGITYTIEEPLVLPDGTTAIYLSKKTPLKNENNQIVGILGISVDITEQRKTEKQLLETEHKLEAMTVVSASIAHELRTPLAGLNLGINTIENMLPHFFQAYKLAVKAQLPIHPVKPAHLALLEQKLVSMRKELAASSAFIDMLLLNLTTPADASKMEIFSIQRCIRETLSRYPFMDSENELINWKKDNAEDFDIKGELLLVTHVLFNLLKNALHHIAKAGKGSIEIWVEQGQPYNTLYFKDTGSGISSEILPHIFDRFFSKTKHGAGVGLTFCKSVMESLGGQITCESHEGDYTLFVLRFPLLESGKHSFNGN